MKSKLRKGLLHFGLLYITFFLVNIITVVTFRWIGIIGEPLYSLFDISVLAEMPMFSLIELFVNPLMSFVTFVAYLIPTIIITYGLNKFTKDKLVGEYEYIRKIFGLLLFLSLYVL